MSAKESVLIHIAGPVATLQLNRLESLNAIDVALIAELEQAFTTLEQNQQVHVVVLASNHPKAFVAGADIKAMQKMSTFERGIFARGGQSLMHRIEQSRLVTIAAVNGFCLGGGLELALACDIIVGGPKALFGLPEVTLGLIPGFGGTQRLIRSIGQQQALGYILSGERFGIDKASELGLVWKQVPQDQPFDDAVAKVAVQIAANAPLALAYAKRLVRQATYTNPVTGCDLEAGAFASLGATQDLQEGLTAFLEKRTATFQGK